MRLLRRVVTLSAFVLVVSLRAGATGAAAQDPQAPQQPTFRSRIDAVTVDAVVTDKQGKPVLDLKPDDFEIKEDGKVQNIDTFKLIRIDDQIDPDPAKYPEIHSMEDQERETARDDTRLFVIYLDDYHVRRGNDMAIRVQLAKWVSSLSLRDLVAVVYPLTPIGALTFSHDHAATADTIMKFFGRKYDYQPMNPYEQIYLRMSPQDIETLRNQVTVSSLASLCTYLGSLRQGRKSVLFVSEGFVGQLPPEVGGAGLPGLPGSAAALGQDRMSVQANQDIFDLMRRVFEAANQSNTAIYSVDPRGLAVSEFDVSQPTVDSREDRRVLNDTGDTLRALSEETDGRAIMNQNNVRPGLAQMVSDSSAYYLLGYTSSQAPRDGKFHEIKVTLKRKGLEVRSRKGYWAYTADDVARAEAPSTPGLPADIATALSGIVAPAQGHAVRTWVGMDRGKDGLTAVTVVWEAVATPGAPAEMTPDHVQVTAGTSAGDLFFHGPVPKEATAASPAGRVTFDAKPGSLDVQVAAQSADGGELDSDHLELTVPDFTAAAALISTPQVFRARTARDVQQLAASTTALPTSARAFSRTETLVVRFRAYAPGGTAPVIALRLLNQNGDAMTAMPTPAPGADGTYQVSLPLAGLAAGDYLVEIAATAGDSKTRKLVGFSVGT